jgi:hypothetical protein
MATGTDMDMQRKMRRKVIIIMKVNMRVRVA